MKSIKIPAKTEYDFESDIFYARPINRKYFSSFHRGEFVFDIDDDKKVVGFEIINASKVFGVPKLFLKNPEKMLIEVVVSETSIFVKISIRQSSKRITSLAVEKIKPNFLKPTEMSLAVV